MLNPSYATTLVEALVVDGKWLTLGSDASFTEIAVTRVDITALLGAASAGEISNDTLISISCPAGPVVSWMLCADSSTSAATSYVSRDLLPVEQLVGSGGGDVEIAIGDLLVKVA